MSLFLLTGLVNLSYSAIFKPSILHSNFVWVIYGMCCVGSFFFGVFMGYVLEKKYNQ